MLLYQIEGCWLMSIFVYSVNCVLAYFMMDVVGYNNYDERLRGNIQKLMRSLHQEDSPLSSLYSRYVRCLSAKNHQVT